MDEVDIDDVEDVCDVDIGDVDVGIHEGVLPITILVVESCQFFQRGWVDANHFKMESNKVLFLMSCVPNQVPHSSTTHSKTSTTRSEKSP